jgi:hypothetical protein
MKALISTIFAVSLVCAVSFAVTLTQDMNMNTNSIINVSNIVSAGGTQTGNGQNIVALGYNAGVRQNDDEGSVNIGYNNGKNYAGRGAANIGYNAGGYNYSYYGAMNIGYLGGAGCTNNAQENGTINIGYNVGRNIASDSGAINIGCNQGGLNDANGRGAINMGYINGTAYNNAGGDGAMNIGYNGGSGLRLALGAGSMTAGYTVSGHTNRTDQPAEGSWAVGQNVRASHAFAYVFGKNMTSLREDSVMCKNLDVQGTPYCSGYTQFQNPSDQRLKQNVKQVENALTTMLKLRGVEYRYTDDAVKQQGLPSNTRMGFLAQEAEKVMPSWVSEMPNGYKGISINGFEALTVEATRELKATVDSQQKEIEQLRKDIAELKKILSK